MNQQEVEENIRAIAQGNRKVAQLCESLNGFYGPGMLATLQSLSLSPEEIWKQFESKCYGHLEQFREWLMEDARPKKG